jgi:hypothetical protein
LLAISHFNLVFQVKRLALKDMSILASNLVTVASLEKFTLLLVLPCHLLLMMSMRGLTTARLLVLKILLAKCIIRLLLAIWVLARTLAACSIPTIKAKLADLLALRLVSLLKPASLLLAKSGLLLLERLLLIKCLLLL